MPVMDSPEYAGKNQGELLRVAKEKGVKVSVVSPRKTPEFIRAFEMAGGDVASAKVCEILPQHSSVLALSLHMIFYISQFGVL